jgi:hypothetical protein
MTAKILEELQGLGFSEYEAKAYVTLLEGGAQTGYQVAKASGIPRPNIYPVLARLRQRGAVNQTEAKGAARYSALAAEQMFDGLGRNFATHLGRARDAVRDLQEAEVAERAWNVEGYERVLERGQALIDAAGEQLFVGVWSNESARLASNVTEAEARGVEVTTLCVQGCPNECGGCRGRIYRHDLNGSGGPRWLVVVRDRAEVLGAQFYESGAAHGAITKMPAFVALATQFLENTVALGEIARSLGPRMNKTLDDGARHALGRSGLRVNASSWLERLIGGDRSKSGRKR